MMLCFDAILSTLPPGPVRMNFVALKDKLHEHNPEMVETFREIESWYSVNVKPLLDDDDNTGELPQFLIQYLCWVESLLHFISSCCSGDWESYLSSLEDIIKYFFARDLFNYARLMSVHLPQINDLEKDDPETRNALKSGAFVVAKSEIPFTCLYTDEALEQEIKKLKGLGGMVGFSRDEAALDRLLTTAPHLTALVNQLFLKFPKTFIFSGRTEHYQLLGEIALKSRMNALKLQKLIKLYCGDNPFKEKAPLKNLISSALLSDEAKSDILQFAEKG